MGFEATEISDGSDETQLVVVTPDTRRDCELERMDCREVYEVVYRDGSSGASCSFSMLGTASSTPGSESSELNDISPSYSSDGDNGS
jgi:hypothetical protein